MEISSPVSPKTLRKYFSEDSAQDICFMPNSQHLVSQSGRSPFVFDYDTTFSQIKSGKLGKKTMNTCWQDRFFVLTPIRLLYYASEAKTQLKGCFNLASLIQHKLEAKTSGAQIMLTVQVENQGSIQNKNILVMLVTDAQTRIQWLTAIQHVIATLKDNMFELKVFPKISQLKLAQSNQKIGRSNVNYWNNITISPTEMLNYASHLDIIFLRNKSIFSSVHRFFMRSYYDHVGILLKDQAEKPYLLEVVNEKGVIISPLENLFNSAHQEYQSIGYRKLLSEPSLLPLEMLENYINSLIGKKYELSLSKLFLNNESVNGEETDVINVEIPVQKPEKTYFCSELIADIYLKFGVLKQGKSHHYWPKDFEEDNVPLSTGYSLTPMMQVQLGPQDSDVSALED